MTALRRPFLKLATITLLGFSALPDTYAGAQRTSASTEQLQKMRILAGNASPDLAKDVAKRLNVAMIPADVVRFKDKEIGVKLKESVRGKNVFIIQPTCYPANENLMELLVMVDALKRGAAGTITVVIPYFGYARQDRKAAPGQPITARLVAKLIQTAGADKVVVVDLHAGQIQGFFDIPIDNLTAAPLFIKDITSRFDQANVMIVSPDVGGTARARYIANYLGTTDIAIVDKHRAKAGESEVMHVVGDVKGRDCILVDDIADSAGTLCHAAKALVDSGAKSVHAYVTHPVLTEGAVKRIQESPLQSFVCTNTIPLSEDKAKEGGTKVRVLDVAALLAEAILRLETNASVSSLFNFDLPEQHHSAPAVDRRAKKETKAA